MSKQRFTIQEAGGMYLHLPIFDNGVEIADGDVCILLNEQQATIDGLEKNFDDIVEWASEIAKRNVILNEKIGKIQQAIRIAYEKKPYPSLEDIQKEMERYQCKD